LSRGNVEEAAHVDARLVAAGLGSLIAPLRRQQIPLQIHRD